MQDIESSDRPSLRFGSTVESLVFVGILLLLFWAPLPFASNRVWAVSILDVWMFVLVGLWVCGWVRGGLQVKPALRKARLPLVLLTAWLAVVGLQLLPMPVALLKLISP